MSRPFTEIPKLINEITEDLRDVLLETVLQIKERVSQEGKPVRYPIDWDSPKQQRFVMRLLRLRGEIPYRRTQRTRLGWQEERTPLGANLRGKHPAGAVFGIPSGWQSRIHRGRWPHLLTVLFEELAKLPDRISQKLTVRGD